MTWRPRALLAPLVVTVLLAAGTPATGVPPAATPARAAECTEMPLARYGEPLPVEADRAADGSGEECYAFTAGTTGPHDLRTWQAADPLEWQARFEVRDVGTGEVLTQGTDWTGVEFDPRRQPTVVELAAGRDYEVLVTGTPYVESHTIVRYDPRYRLGVLDRTSTDGCTTAEPSGWQDPALTGRLRAGAVTCQHVDLPRGEWARIDFRSSGDLPSQVRGRVLDADGGLACRDRAAAAGSLEAGECRLAGAGPYRFLTHAGNTVEAADYSLRVTSLTSDAGCRPAPWATWGEPLPAVRTLDVTGTDCWTVDLPRDSRHRVSVAEDADRWRDRTVRLYRAEDGAPTWYHGQQPAGTYRVVVSGEAGPASGGYRLGVFDHQGRASDGTDLAESCPVLGSTSLGADPVTGRTERGGYDCYRVPPGVDGPLLTRMTRPGDPQFAGALLGPDGWTSCGTSSVTWSPCDLDRGSYRVLVGHTGEGIESAPYGFILADPTDRTGCLPPSAAGPDSGLAVADLPAGGPGTCVALDDAHDRLMWSVDAHDDVQAEVRDGTGDDVCTWEPDDDGPELCHLRDFVDHRAPFTVVLTNDGTQDRRARMFLRSDPAAEQGCTQATWSDGNGPLPLLGRTDGGLDAECHSLDMVSGGVLLNRSNLDGADAPDVLVYDPSGEPICGDWGDDEPERLPDCYTSSEDGRYVFWVLGDADSVGRYRVDLGCDNLRVGCAQAPPVDFTESTMKGRVTVGRTLRAGVRGVPPRGRVSWRWYVGDRVVRRTKVYTPKGADRGRRLRVQAVVTAPKYPRRVIRTPARTVRPR